MIRKAVLPVAGLGTRMLPVTKVVPKELLSIIDRPTIEYVVDEALASGIDTLIFIISQGKEDILNYFNVDLGLKTFLKERKKWDLLKKVEEVEEKVKNIISVIQKIPEGLGQAVLMAEKTIGNEPFAVLLGDDLVDAKEPCLKQMMQAHLQYGGSIIAIEEVPLEDISKYGIIEGERLEERVIRIKRVVEKPSLQEAPSNLAIIGRYIFQPVIFEFLKKIEKSVGGEYQLTDAIQLLIEEGYEVYGYIFEGKRLDTGNKKGFLKTILHYAKKDEELKEVLKEFYQEFYQVNVFS